jgi:hypothetical protein
VTDGTPPDVLPFKVGAARFDDGKATVEIQVDGVTFTATAARGAAGRTFTDEQGSSIVHVMTDALDRLSKQRSYFDQLANAGARWVEMLLRPRDNKVAALQGLPHEHVPRDALAVAAIREQNAQEHRDWPLRWTCWCGQMIDDATREPVQP